MAVIAYHYRIPLINYYQHDIGILVVPIIVSFITLIALICYKHNKLVAYILLIIFTLSMAMILAIAILPYSPQTLIAATTATSVSVIIINLCAFYCAMKDIDFTYMGPGLFGILGGIIVLSLFQLLINSTILGIIISVIGVILFSAYLLYDLNQLYNRTNNFEEDPILAAINIYLDIINLFLYILEFLQLTSNDN